MTPDERETICRGCEFFRNALGKGGCLNVRDESGRVSWERLLLVIEGKRRCPIGRHDEAQLLRGRNHE